LAKRGTPSKLDEDMGDGVTRREAALAAVEQGMRLRHVAGAAGVTGQTLLNWRNADPSFLGAYMRAQSRGVARLLTLSESGEKGSGQAVQLLSVCHGYHYSRAEKDWEESDEDKGKDKTVEELAAIVAPIVDAFKRQT